MAMQQLRRNMAKKIGAMRAFSGLAAKAAGGGTAAPSSAVAQWPLSAGSGASFRGGHTTMHAPSIRHFSTGAKLPGGGRMGLLANLKKMLVDPERKFRQKKIGATMAIQHLGRNMAKNFAAMRAFSAFAAKAAGGGMAAPSCAVHQLARGPLSTGFRAPFARGGKARVPSNTRHFTTGDPGGLSPDDEAALKFGMAMSTGAYATCSVLFTFISVCKLAGINLKELAGVASEENRD